MKKEFGGTGFRHLHAFNLAMLGSKVGDSNPTRILWFIMFSKLNIFN